MPYGVNAADFILDLASADVRTEKLEGEEAREHLIECYEQYAVQNPHFDGYREGQELSERVMGSGLWAAARTRVRVACLHLAGVRLQPEGQGAGGE
jgi:hypothetical protein